VDEVGDLVDKAIRAAIPPDGFVERKLRPDSACSWREPAPAAGLTAALAVVKAAQQQAYKFVRGLRSEGVSWREAAGLLQVPWVEERSQAEVAFELVCGPEPEGWRTPSVYWRCGGPSGCGKYITDRGPYNCYPSDNEDGHADGCRRLAAEDDAYLRESELREERARVAEQAMQQIPEGFGKQTVVRARGVLARGGRYRPWSTSEALAVALALRDDEQLKRQGYSSRQSALDRVFEGTPEPREGRDRWLAGIRAAATGETA
jgi:hypothetical protein